MSRGGRQRIRRLHGRGEAATAAQGRILQPGQEAECAGNSRFYGLRKCARSPVCTDGSVAKACACFTARQTFHI